MDITSSYATHVAPGNDDNWPISSKKAVVYIGNRLVRVNTITKVNVYRIFILRF